MQLTPELVDAFDELENKKPPTRYSIREYMEPGETIWLEAYPFPPNGARFGASVVVHRNNGTTSIYWNFNEKRQEMFLKFKHKFEGGEKFDKDMKDLLT